MSQIIARMLPTLLVRWGKVLPPGNINEKQTEYDWRLRSDLVVGRLLVLQEAEPGNEPNNPTPGFGVKECRAGGKGGAGHAIEDC